MKRTKADFKKIKTIFEFVWNNPHSSFYKDKYKKAGIKSIKGVDSFGEFEKLPLLTRNEILKAGPYNFFFLPQNKVGEIGFSSGTTSNNLPLVLFQSQITKKYLKKRYKKVLELKVKSHMMLYSTLSGQQRFSSWKYFWKDGLKLAWGDINNLELTAKIANRLKIDAIQTNPTVLYYFLPYLKKEYDLSKIKLIIIGGEFCSEQKAQFLKSNFKDAFFEFTYGGMETRGKGYRCDYLSKLAPRFFHPFSDFYYFETVENNGQDELVMTTLDIEGTPLIRYRTGDAVRLYEEACKCGKNARMEVFGRLEHDSLRIQGSLIHSELVSKAITNFSQYLATPDWKLHVFEEKTGGKILPKLKLQLVPNKNSAKIKKLIQTGVSKSLFMSSKLTLSDLVKKGVFLPLEIEFLEEFPMELKRKQIISHLT